MSADEEERQEPEEIGAGGSSASALPEEDPPAEDRGAAEAEPQRPAAEDAEGIEPAAAEAEGVEPAAAAPEGEAAPAEAGGERGEEASQPLIRLSQEDLQKGIEAVLFSTGEPIPIRELAELFEASVHDVREAVEELRLRYVNEDHAYRLEEIAGGVQILTLSRFEPWIRKHLTAAREGRLSPAAFETLAVIAYKQPITKASLEAIRGVQCGPILKTLLDRNLIKVVGREESLGKPLLYGTTKRFLESFGIGSITSLPQPEIDLPGLANPEQN